MLWVFTHRFDGERLGWWFYPKRHTTQPNPQHILNIVLALIIAVIVNVLFNKGNENEWKFWNERLLVVTYQIPNPSLYAPKHFLLLIHFPNPTLGISLISINKSIPQKEIKHMVLHHQQPMEVVIVQTLRLAWVAATLPIIIASIPTPKLTWLRRTLLTFARRGKIMHSSQVTPLSHSTYLLFYPFTFFTHFPHI